MGDSSGSAWRAAHLWASRVEVGLVGAAPMARGIVWHYLLLGSDTGGSESGCPEVSRWRFRTAATCWENIGEICARCAGQRRATGGLYRQRCLGTLEWEGSSQLPMTVAGVLGAIRTGLESASNHCSAQRLVSREMAREAECAAFAHLPSPCLPSCTGARATRGYRSLGNGGFNHRHDSTPETRCGPLISPLSLCGVE